MMLAGLFVAWCLLVCWLHDVSWFVGWMVMWLACWLHWRLIGWFVVWMVMFKSYLYHPHIPRKPRMVQGRPTHLPSKPLTRLHTLSHTQKQPIEDHAIWHACLVWEEIHNVIKPDKPSQSNIPRYSMWCVGFCVFYVHSIQFYHEVNCHVYTFILGIPKVYQIQNFYVGDSRITVTHRSTVTAQ